MFEECGISRRLSGTEVGQNALKRARKAYDVFARERVLAKLEVIWNRYESMGKERTAAEIADFRGYEFDRKNFSRLLTGPLPDSRVNDIVKWITARHDANFEETLESEVDYFSNPAVSRHVVFSRQDWLMVDPREAAAMAAQWHLIGPPAGYLSQCSIAYRALSFLQNARVLRITPLRANSLSAPALYLLQIEDRFLPISGNGHAFGRHGLSNRIDLNPYTIFDFIRFHFEVVDADRGFHLISSRLDFLYHLLETTELSFEEASALIEAGYHSLIDPPMIERDVETGRFRVRLDCIAAQHYRRLFISVEADGTISIDRDVKIKPISINKDREGAKTPPAATTIDIGQNDDLDRLFHVLRLTRTGTSLLASADAGKVSFCAIEGPANRFHYDADSRTVVHTVNSLTIHGLGYQALSLAMALRFADQDLLGVRLPDPYADMSDYATVAHGKNLDAIVCVCRLATELEAMPDLYKSALVYLENFNILALYEATKEKASFSQLFEIYKIS